METIDYNGLFDHAECNDKYDKYLTLHKLYVTKAYSWLKTNLPELLEEENFIEEISYYGELDEIINQHDSSKYTQIPDPEHYYDLNCEYDAYADYFYGERTHDVVTRFDQAWLSHIHRNPHHWQHWVLLQDDDIPQIKVLDMPYVFVVEMVCDHWSFGWASGNLNALFEWYESHKKKMVLSEKTRKTYESILKKIQEKLTQMD